MTNHQGGMGRLNGNANNQNEVNPHLSGALGLLPFAISPTGGDQRFQDRVSGSNHLLYKETESVNTVPNNVHSAGIFAHESSEELRLPFSSSHAGYVGRFPDSVSGSSVLHYQQSNTIVPSNDRSAGVVTHNMDLNAEFAGNNHYNSLNVSLGLCLHPNGQENQNINNSSITVIDSGVSRYIVEEQGLNGSSLDVRRLACKRRSPEQSVRELLIGESSSMAAQVANSKRRASEVNPNNSLNLNIPLPCTGPVSHQEPFETRIGHGTLRPISDMQHSRQSESFQSNIHLHRADQQACLQPSILSSGYTRDAHVQLPCHPPFSYQYNHPPTSRPSETPVGAISSGQTFEHIPNFHETLQDIPSINILSPRSVCPSISPVYTAAESGPVVPPRDPRNIAGNSMLGPQIGTENWAHTAGNLSFVNGTANFSGEFAYPSHSGFVSRIHPSNAPTWVPMFNFAENYVQTPSGIMNHPVVASISFPIQSNNRPSDSNSSAASQEMVFNGLGNAISQIQRASEESSENQAVSSPDDPYSIWSPANAENRVRLMIVLRNALQHLRSGGSLRRQDFIMLDHSIILHLLGEISDQEEVQLDVENMAYEDLVVLEEHIGSVNNGLSEEDIVSHLRQEKFQSILEMSTENESCCICQEEYVENEDLGKLDCGHRFHVDCIKPWLLRKNTCPICKQIALAAAEAEDEDEDEEEDDP